MNRKTKSGITWAFWVLITFLPLIVAMVMFLLKLGFNRWLWMGTLTVAFLGFFKAQQSVNRLRSVAEDEKIEHWLAAIRRKRMVKRREAAHRSDDDQSEFGEQVTEFTTGWRISRGWTSFRKPNFWRQRDKVPVIKHAGNLFHLLGLEVKQLAPSIELGQCLLVNGNTVISAVKNGAQSASDSAELLSTLISNKASCKVGILISPRGFKMATRNEYEEDPLILLDADNLAELSRRYIG